MSVAAVGDTTKVEDQERICRELAAGRGWEVVDVYPDNSKSAWQKNRKRPQWNRMLGDVEAGRINAIIVYHGDRLIRQPDDLGALLKLADGKGVKLASPTGTRDLGSGDDRFILYIEAAMAMRESDNTSRRRKAQYERWRREGRTRPGGRGGRAFGFRKDGVTHVEAETKVIQEAATAILAGEPTRSIARRLAADGVRSTAGGTMSPATLRQILMRPRYAGLMPDGEHQAAWEPVLDRETWEAVRGALLSRKAQPGSGRAIKYLLSGIATCGACQHPLWSSGMPGSYRCHRIGCGKVARSRVMLDAYVEGRIVGYLGRAKFRNAKIHTDPAASAELAVLAERRTETETAIEEYAGNPGRLALLNRVLDRIEARETQLRARLEETGRARLLGAHAGTSREGFRALPLAVRRALVQACYKIEVLPDPRRGRGFDVDAIRMTRI